MNSKLHELEKLYERVVKEIKEEDELCRYLLKIYNDLIITLSEASSLHFNTLFARVSFITSRYPINKSWAYALQIPRREIHQRELSDKVLLPIIRAAIEFLLVLCHNELNGSVPGHLQAKPNLPPLPEHKRAGRYKKKFARVIAVEWDKADKQLTILDEEEPDTSCILQYSVSGVNDIFADTLELAIQEIGLPLILGLTDIDCTEANYYIPSFIVIMPDLLMDVTTITQVMTSGSDPLAINIIDTFLPSSSSEAILTGQVANFFLDELIRDTTKSFQELFTASFKIYPIEFVGMTDEKLKEMYNRMKAHYDNILKVITERFPALGIDRKQCVIEPSYFSPQYGIKGRLDLYFEHEEEQSASIIELKSNRPFKPNSYGLSSSNYHQTLLYELLIKSSHGPKHHRANFILYSAESQDTLRYAVSVESIQKETIHNRNQLVLLQNRMMKLDQDPASDMLHEIDPQRYESIKGYVKKNIENWYSVYASLSQGEKNYFKCFVGFITREHMLARIGSERGDGSGGLAGLWLDKIESKEERYQILQGLELMSLEKDAHQTTLTFIRTDKTNPLANFRAGDIAVMYPYKEGQVVDPTRYQLHRANVIRVDAQSVVIRLRNMQIHTGQIEQTKYWNLEHDLLDSSFRALYQSLWALMSVDALTRQYILGLIPPPKIVQNGNLPLPPGLTPAQQVIYHEAIEARFLYLLWGPPGTGKTSMMLKSWVWYYFRHTTARIALLAYTNKAVDEICEVLQDSGADVNDHYIRIGSRAATGESFRHRLLDNVTEPMHKRAEIKNLLDQTRIFVATVASLHGKSELFKLISFDVVIMDEASQLLEPTVVGLLSRFRKTILIGDHMQLPAVSIQPEHTSKVKPGVEWSERIGLTSMSMSYFERLYRLYQTKGWDHVIGTLNEQGRMHADIMEFANTHVYNGLLRTADGKGQSLPMSEWFAGETSILFNERLIYIPSSSSLKEAYMKTNQDEARITIALISEWQKKLEAKKLNWTIGVITPFRAQIAAITHLGHQMNMDLSKVTIDTVERYQGGARDIIIMSCAVNSQQTLSRITSVNADGVDRKLNVAVTRARQQFILIGQKEILQHEAAYSALIEMSKIYTMESRMEENIIQ
jgi:DNA replication ATP-dependent helicase Dna2